MEFTEGIITLVVVFLLSLVILLRHHIPYWSKEKEKKQLKERLKKLCGTDHQA